MDKKVKKICSLFLALILLVSPISVMADFTEPGQAEYAIEDLSLESAQELAYDFYLPFDTNVAEITYSVKQDANLTIFTGIQTKSVKLDAQSSAVTLNFETVERKGERQFVFRSDIDVTMDVSFARYTYNSGFGVSGTNIQLSELTDEERAISSAIIIDEASSAIIVRGALRYINNENPKALPEKIDGSIYLPARVLALSLGCYYENIPSRNYILLRESNSGREFYFKQDDCYIQTNRGEKQELKFKPVYKSGEPYLPIRFFAEELNKTVGYKNGLVVIDDKYSVDKILNDDLLFQYAKDILGEFVPVELNGNVYHVSQSSAASDSNPGTQEQPLRTLTEASARAEAGDTVIIHKGVWREELAPQKDGTATNPIVFRAAEGEKVVLSATEVVDNFVESTENPGWAEANMICDLGEGRNQVFFGGEALAEARYPNGPVIEMSSGGEPLSPLFPVCGDFNVDPADKTLVTSDTLLKEAATDYWKGATFVSMHGYGWTLSTAKVSSSSAGRLKLDENSFAKKWWYDRADHDSLWNYGYISGHKNAIDTPGEWVIEDGKLLIMPPQDVDISDLSVEVKARQTTINLTGRKYVQIIGLESFGGGATMLDSEMCMLNDVDMRYISHYTHSDDQREGYITDGSNTAKKINGKKGAPAKGEVGVYVGGRNNIVINSSFDHSAAAGLYLGGAYAYIDNNEIKNCGYMGSYVSGIFACSEPWGDALDKRGGFSIYNNTVFNAGRGLITVLGTEFLDDGNITAYQWRTPDGKLTYNIPYLPYEVAYNDLHDGTLFAMDSGLYYSYMVTCNSDKLKSRVHNNYLYLTSGETNPWNNGIYSDGGSIGVDYFNNMIFTTERNTRFSYSYITVGKNSTTSTRRANAEIKAPVTGGTDALTAEQFPLGKPFAAGKTSDDDYLLNYSKASESAQFYSVSNATLDGAAYDALGGAKLDSSNDVICFENVDFKQNGSNRVNIYYYADKYKDLSVLAVYVGDSIQTAKKCEVRLPSDADTPDTIDFVSADIGKIVGTKNVYIKTGNSCYSSDASILGIMVSDDGNSSVGHNAENITAANFDRIHTLSSVAQAARVASSGYGSYVMNNANGTVLVYEDVNVDQTSSKLALTFRGFGDNPRISFYLNDLNSTPFFTCTSKNTNGAIETITHELGKTLDAGTYDIYVKFSIGSTLDLYSFGILP